MPSKNAMTKVSKHIEKGVPESVGCGVLSGTHIPKLGLWYNTRLGASGLAGSREVGQREGGHMGASL